MRLRLIKNVEGGELGPYKSKFSTVVRSKLENRRGKKAGPEQGVYEFNGNEREFLLGNEMYLTEIRHAEHSRISVST